MDQGMLLGLIFSVMINLFIVAFILATKIGQDSWTRWRNKQKYKKGGYVYSLMMSKDGNLQEIFTKIKEGKFKYAEHSYIRNPRLLTSYRGIPAYIHREDDPAPVNIWGADFDSNLMSAAEMDTVMNSQVNFDFKEWVSKITPFLLIGAVIVVGTLAALAYFDYMTYQMLRDGTFKAVEIAASAAVPAPV